MRKWLIDGKHVSAGDCVRHRSNIVTGGGHGILLRNGRVFVADRVWRGVVSWRHEELEHVGSPIGVLWEQYVEALLTEGELK